MSKISDLLDEVKIYKLCNHCDFYEHTESGNGCRSGDYNCKEEIEKQIISEIRADAIEECIKIFETNTWDYTLVNRLEMLKEQKK